MKAPEITVMAIAMVVACIPAASSGFTIISVKKAEQGRLAVVQPQGVRLS